MSLVAHAQHPTTQDPYSLQCVGNGSDLLTWPENFFTLSLLRFRPEQKGILEYLCGFYILCKKQMICNLNKSIVYICW